MFTLNMISHHHITTASLQGIITNPDCILNICIVLLQNIYLTESNELVTIENTDVYKLLSKLKELRKRRHSRHKNVSSFVLIIAFRMQIAATYFFVKSCGKTSIFLRLAYME